MLFVRCMPAWRAPPRPGAIPISRSMAALSTAPSSAAGGKSTTRKIEPQGGGATPISRSAASALPELSAGVVAGDHAPGRLHHAFSGRGASGGERPKAELPLGLGYRGRVSRRDAPVIVAVGGPFPVFGLSGPVRAADALDFGGVLHRGAERRDEIREDVVAGPVTAGAPEGRYPRVLHPADAAHHSVDVGHFESDVIEQGIVRLRVRDRVVDAVAAPEIHDPGAIGDAKPEHLHREARAGFPVPRVEDDVRHLKWPVAVRAQFFRALFLGDEPEHVALGAFDEIAGPAAGLVEVAGRAEPRP